MKIRVFLSLLILLIATPLYAGWEYKGGTEQGGGASSFVEITALWASGACGSNYMKGDGTCDTPAGGGDVVKVGTPVDSQVGVWTGNGTIEGAASFTYDGANLQLTGDIGSTGARITKGWFIDLQVTNAIAGSITGNAGTVTNGVYTGDAGTVFLAPNGDGSGLSGVVTAETDPIVGAIIGLVKANGAGAISAAVEDTDYQGVLAEGAFADGDKTKLNGIETGADVTDTANVTSAGALMDSECSSLADVKALNQSVISGASPTFTGTNFTGIPSSAITTIVSTVDFSSGAFLVDGAQCTVPQAITINSGPKTIGVNCADNAASAFYFDMRMPDSWDGGTFVVYLVGENGNATPSGNLDFDVSVQCRGDSEVINSTYGTAQNVVVGFDTQYDLEQASSSAITPNCTTSCAGGDKCFFKAVMDDTGTTTEVADTYILDLSVEWTSNVGD